MGYFIMKFLHIFFVILFLGNIIVTIFWKLYADKTNDPKIISHTIRGIIKSDRIFTHTGVTGILIFGFGAQGIGGYSITTGWILYSIILFALAALAFFIKVIPTQKKMLALAESSQFNLEEYNKLSNDWKIWGIISTLLPIIAVVLMVIKVPY